MFKGVAYPGEHPAILDRALFDAVQTRLDAQCNGSSSLRSASGALLAGKLFDDRGHRMMPSHATKNGVRYRYYVSRALLDGRPADAGSVRRISAPAIEARILDVLQSELGLDANAPDAIAIIERVEVGQDRIRVAVRRAARDGEEPELPECLDLPWRHPSSRRHRDLIAGPDHDRPAKPMAAQSRVTLLQGIARGRRWLDEIMNAASATPESIAAREGCTRRQVNATLSLASLSPAIIEAVIAGRVPYGIGLRDLTDPPLAWSEQQRIVGRAS